MYCQLFFFFKQKTAYELRISDWSSDVCSSDLPVLLGQLGICLKEGTNSDQRRLTVQTTLLLVEICRQHTGRATHFAFLGAIENMRGPFKHMIDVVEQSRRIPGAPRGFVKQVDRRQLAAQLAKNGREHV